MIALIGTSSKVLATQYVGLLGQSCRRNSPFLAILPLCGYKTMGDLVSFFNPHFHLFPTLSATTQGQISQHSFCFLAFKIPTGEDK